MSKGKSGAAKKGQTPYVAVGLVVVLIVLAGLVYNYTSSHSNSPTTPGGCSAVTDTDQAQELFACVTTHQGDFEIELFPAAAPKTVANFVKLVNEGFYNNLVWHRIVKGFVIQTGDPTTRNAGGNPANWGQGGSNQTVPLENDTNLGNNYGFLGMARGQSIDSGTSQWFINLADNTGLNGQYTVFGEVVYGMNVVLAIGNLPVNSACASSGGLSCQPTNPTQAEVLKIVMLTTS